MTDTETGDARLTSDMSSTAHVLEKLEYRCIGPHRGGRVVAVTGHPTDQMTFYFGAVGGGVWKTTDGGQYWDNISDGFFSTAAVGALAISESDPNVMFAGTGETAIRGNVSHGDGVYRSTDAGKSWTNVGLHDTRHIATIRIHPQNPDHVYVAALGHAWGPNEERGVFRTTDGGGTWEKILYQGEGAGAIDLSMDPSNPRLLYAALWDAQRYPHTLRSGGPGSGLFRSNDGGDTWVDITRNTGLPRGIIGKIGVAVSPAQAGRVWALIEAKDGALFRSDDGGDTWTRQSEEGGLRSRAWYYTHLIADPSDPNTCWVCNLQLWKSVDGGATFGTVPTAHGDNHDLWIDPHNSMRMIEGNDGGAQVTFNGALSWSSLYNQPTAQMYHATTDTRVPYRVYGSQQDNSALCIPSMSLEGAITPMEWYQPGGGESGYIAVRPDNPDIVFGGAIGSGGGNGSLWRYDHATKQVFNITVWPEVTGMAEGAESLKYRFQWTFPVTLSPHDPNVLYVTSNHVHRSTDEGRNWETISDDLTRNDPKKLKPSGGPITRDNTGAEVYCTIFAFVESPHEQGTFWVGTDDGLVKISRDGGASWADVTPPDLPEWALISIIEVSPHNPSTAYIAATRYKSDDPTPYLYKTSDYGVTWTYITQGIPANDFTRVIREDPEQHGLLYAGTETGLYVSFDDGMQWQRMQGNLPVCPIHDLVIKDGELVVATHGRSFWILEDLSVPRQLAREAQRGTVRLFAPDPTPRYRRFEWFFNVGPGVSYSYAGPLVIGFRQKELANGGIQRTLLDAGKNPPNGVVIRYVLPERPASDITIAILDADGSEVRSFQSRKDPKAGPERDEEDAPAETVLAGAAEGQEGTLGIPSAVESEDAHQPTVPKEEGLNRFVWDMRMEAAHAIADDKSAAENPFLFGPTVLPGRYTARLTVDDVTMTEDFTIVPDPRGTGSLEDLQTQYDVLLRIRDTLTEVNDGVTRIRDVKNQLESWEKRFKDQPSATSVLNAITAVKTALTAIENELAPDKDKVESPLQYPAKLDSKIAWMVFAVDFNDCAPSTQAVECFNDLARQADAQIAALQHVLNTDLPALNASIRDADLPVIAPGPLPSEKSNRAQG